MTITINIFDANVTDIATALRYDPSPGAEVTAEQKSAIQDYVSSILLKVLNNYRTRIKPSVNLTTT